MDIAHSVDIHPITVGNDLRNQAKTLEADPKELDRVAVEFESVFLTLLLKEMRESMTTGGLFENDPGGTYGSLFDLYMGRHLAESGGVGLAETIRQHYLAPSE